jgi:hypothetical protein
VVVNGIVQRVDLATTENVIRLNVDVQRATIAEK